VHACARDKFNSSFEKYDFQIDYGSFMRDTIVEFIYF
jgi:hypothetical protein